MEFPSNAGVNCLIWITSLDENEKGVTRRVIEDLEPFYRDIGLHWEYHEPQTATELISLLDDLSVRSKSGWRPLLHLDTHGSIEAGIKIQNSGEFVSWPILADKLRAINCQTENNLCVISHACFSFEIVRQLDISRPTPFFMLFAPLEEILAGTIESNTVGFYKDVFNGIDVLTAHERWFPNDWQVFHCERMVAIVLAAYIDAACIGQRAQRRKEDLITKAVKGGVANNRKNLRMMRSIAAKQIRPTPDLLSRLSDAFLIGRSPQFTVSELVELVKNARRTGRAFGPSPYDSPNTSI